MVIMKWSEELDTFVEEMNDEHKHLLELMNDLHESYSSEGSNYDFKSKFYNLQAYTIEHFASEEEFMKDMDYSDRLTHEVTHRKLIATFKEHEEILLIDGIVNESFFDFLKFWLRSHLIGTDTMYGKEYLKSKKSA